MLFLRKLRLLLLPSAGRRREADLDEELRSHLDLATDAARERGLPDDEARRAARREVGNVTQAREESRAVWTFASLERLSQDLRYGWRSLARSWTFALVAIGSLGLGIGAATTMFSLVNVALLKPLPYRAPQELVFVREIVQPLEHVYPTLPVNIQHFRFWRDHARSFVSMAALLDNSETLTGFGEPHVVFGTDVSWNLFQVLGVDLQAGRSFLQDEEQPDKNRVVVVTDGFWRREMQASPRAIGSTVTLDGVPHTVVGILPAPFHIPGGADLGPLAMLDARSEFFRPIGKVYPGWGGDYDYVVFGRLRPGTSIAKAAADLDVLERDVDRAHQLGYRLNVRVTSLQEAVGGPVRTSLVVLLGAVLVLVLIVCFNLEGLMLARSNGRAREFSIRAALGAGRRRLLQQALTEAVALSLAGGVLGVSIAVTGVHAFRNLEAIHVPRLAEATVDSNVLLFALLLTMISPVLFGLVPAWRATARQAGADALRSGGRRLTQGRASSRLRESLVAIEVGLSVVLLMLGGLLTSSLIHVLQVDRGFAGERVVTARIALSPIQYRSVAARTGFYERALDAVRTIPGVRAAGYINRLPLTGESNVDSVRLEGADQGAMDPVAGKLIEVNVRYVSAGYFDAIGIGLLRGRLIEERDRAATDSAVVSEQLAGKLWPGQDPIGKRLTTGAGAGTVQVVGVVRDVHSVRLDQPPTHIVYVPYWQRAVGAGDIVVKSAMADADTVMGKVQDAIHRVDKATPVPAMKTMDNIVSASVAERTFQMQLAAGFALAALLLATMGVYGVIAYMVTQRRNEIGIRMALGAAPAQVLALVAGRGLRPVVAGMVAGTGVALALGQVIRSLLFGVSATDPLTLTLVAIIVLGVSTLACVVPSRAALKTDPSSVLRLE